MKIILLGPPGSGKGTVADEMSKKYKLPSLSPGELLRKEIKKKSWIGRKIHKKLAKGDLVPSNLVFNLVKKHIKGKNSFILDGAPRDLWESQLLDKYLKTQKAKIDLVLFINVPKKVCVERLHKREKKIKREDDRTKIIDHRFSVYKRQTLPVIKKYQNKKMLKRVNGNQSQSKVMKDVFKIVDNIAEEII